MKYLLLILVFIFIAVPEYIYAANDFFVCEGAGCDGCHLVLLGEKILNWLIGVLTVVFAVVVAIAGFGLATSGGNPSAKEEAKKKMVNAIIGIIIVLAAWLLIDTLFKGLVEGGDGKIDGKPWSTIECGPGQAATGKETAVDQVGAPAKVNGVATPAGVPLPAGQGELDQASAEALLASEGILVKPGASLEGVKENTIDEVMDLNLEMKRVCPECKPITITEATGGTHSSGDFSHSKGYKLDLRTADNPGLVDYVKSEFQPAGTWRDGTPLYYDPVSCGTYAIEKDHLDVVYKTGC